MAVTSNTITGDWPYIPSSSSSWGISNPATNTIWTTGSTYSYLPEPSKYVRPLPLGDLDAPKFCSRCRAELGQTNADTVGMPVFNPYTGDEGEDCLLLLCPSFMTDPNGHDGWILPETR